MLMNGVPAYVSMPIEQVNNELEDEFEDMTIDEALAFMQEELKQV